MKKVIIQRRRPSLIWRKKLARKKKQQRLNQEPKRQLKVNKRKLHWLLHLLGVLFQPLSMQPLESLDFRLLNFKSFKNTARLENCYLGNGNGPPPS